MRLANASWFGPFAKAISRATGRPLAFGLAVAMIATWAVSGPLFDFSDAWQLTVNTATTIVTFLMVFVIQHTQNRDTAAMHIKLDELIRATKGAHNALLDLEELDEEQLLEYLRVYERLAKEARERLERGRVDTGAPDVKERHQTRSAKGA